MRTNRLVTVSLILAVIVLGVTAYAQMVMRPYRNGSVWNIAFIRMKPGMETAYLNYLTTDWKRGQEAAKQEGIILSYKVLSTESHGGNDWNLLLMTEYKDLATMEANEAKADALTHGSSDRMKSSDKVTATGARSAKSWGTVRPAKSFSNRASSEPNAMEQRAVTRVLLQKCELTGAPGMALREQRILAKEKVRSSNEELRVKKGWRAVLLHSSFELRTSNFIESHCLSPFTVTPDHGL